MIQEAQPRVLLRLMPIVSKDAALADSLDYTQNDDSIVGIASTLSKAASCAAVSMLADDSVAASTAQSVGLSFRLIPEHWKRAAEETREAKQLRELQKDLATYRSQEPTIAIRNASEPAETTVAKQVVEPFSSNEIDRLLELLQKRFPRKEDYPVPPAKTEADGTEISYELPDNEAS